MSLDNGYGTQDEKKLTFFASPVKMRKLSNSTDGTYSGSQSEDGFNIGAAQQISERTNNFRMDDDNLDELPEFQRHEEATNMELFYDLFFVANLTTFSTIHEINDIDTLTSYIGFFCILWFTWCQVSSFDVRFVADSVLERIAKAVHMGVMVGMATVGPNFDTHSQHANSLKTMALVLMVSRFVLAFQYLSVGWHVRKHRNTKVPFALIAAVNFTSGIIYFAVSFTFGKVGRSMAYRSFYVLAVFEIVCNIAISIIWKVLTFKHTHLVQRMSLLTLIILGEGVIVVSKNIAKIVQKDHPWDAATIGTLTAAVGIIYFLYMLYFDALPCRHFGSTRQQIWAFMHFPFHLALILFMEGTAEFVIWHKMWAIAANFMNTVDDLVITANLTNTLYDGQSVGATISDLTNNFTTLYPPVYTDTSNEITEILDTITAGFNATFSKNMWFGACDNLTSAVMHSAFETYGFESPVSANSNGTAPTPSDAISKDFGVISLVYIYFFVSAGATLILMGLLNLLTLPKSQFKREGLRHPGPLLRIAAFILLGLGTSIMAITVNYDAGNALALSAWILPTAMLVIFAVGVVQYVPVKSFKEKENMF